MLSRDNTTAKIFNRTPSLWIFLLGQIPALCFLFQQEITGDLSELLRLAGIVLGVSGLTFFALTTLLTLRHAKIEHFFNGLDTLYRCHHVMGMWCVIFIAGHIVCLVLSNYLNSTSAAIYLLTIWSQPKELFLGWASFLLLLIVAIAASRLDRGHRLWRYLHLLSLPAYIFAIYHFYSLSTSSGVLRTALYVLLFGGLCAGVLRIFKYTFAIGYKVKQVEHLSKDLIAITLTPQNKPMRHKAGQYVFAAFHTSLGYQACNEFHPFSITSSPEAEELQLIVKARGDCSCKLQYVVPGVLAHIEGPYGGFKIEPGDQVWIGAGVGVAPFVPLLMVKSSASTHVDLYYVTGTDAEHVLLPHLKKAAENNPHILIHAISVKEDADRLFYLIKERTPDYEKRDFLISGPPQIVREMQKLLLSHGVPQSMIKHETFGFLLARCLAFFILTLVCFDSPALAQQQPMSFTASEVAVHNSNASCWLIINDKVYDVTPYLPKHPAPPKSILNYCGKEATSAFNTKDKGKSHSERATKLLSSYLIGEIRLENSPH